MKELIELSPYYPVFLKVREKKCLVVGGGEVALRKVKALLEHGANVEVISPELCPELSEIAENGAIQVHQRNYKAEDLIGILIAIVATDDTKVNEIIAADARKRGILANVVDDLEHSDFIVPSYFTQGDVIIAVSTSGKSPALARKIRTELEKDFGVEYVQLAQIASEVRLELKQQGIMVDNDAWQEVLDLGSLSNLIRDGRNQEAKDIILNNLKTSKGKKP